MKKYFILPRKSSLVIGIGLLFVYVYVTGGRQTWVYERYDISGATSQHRPRYSNLSGDSRTLAIAKDIARKGKPLLISVVNNAFLPLAHSWLCNTQFMEVHDQVVFIVPDVTSRKDLERKWPNIHVVDVTHLGHARGSLNFSTAGYVRLMVYRTKLLNKLLINNVDLFLFEVDAVWFRNPVYDIKHRLGTNDIAVVLVTTFKDIFAGGLLYMKATNRTKNIWAELTIKMNQLGEKIKGKTDGHKISEAENDQAYLSSLLMRKFGNIQVAQLPGDVYADGKWYTDKEKNPNPILINNNWVIGRDAKITRAIKFKHWFWNMTLHTCDFDLVHKTCKNSG